MWIQGIKHCVTSVTNFSLWSIDYNGNGAYLILVATPVCMCVCVCVLPNCVSAVLYDPEMRWHDAPLPPHTPHLSTALLLYSSPSHPTGCSRRQVQTCKRVRLFWGFTGWESKSNRRNIYFKWEYKLTILSMLLNKLNTVGLRLKKGWITWHIPSIQTPWYLVSRQNVPSWAGTRSCRSPLMVVHCRSHGLLEMLM